MQDMGLNKMPKKSKLSTPAWILEGYDSLEEYNKAKGIKKEKKKEKTFKIKVCPECNSDDVHVVLSELDSEEESNTGREWECKKCKWRGDSVDEKEITEEEMMELLDKRGEDVA